MKYNKLKTSDDFSRVNCSNQILVNFNPGISQDSNSNFFTTSKEIILFDFLMKHSSAGFSVVKLKNC